MESVWQVKLKVRTEKYGIRLWMSRRRNVVCVVMNRNWSGIERDGKWLLQKGGGEGNSMAAGGKCRCCWLDDVKYILAWCY
jgi:hypothetical protein